MFGPCPAGHWTKLLAPRDFKHLRVGQIYRVATAFNDYDGTAHPPGERWTFLGSNFSPYEDGLSLFVSLDGAQEWHIRLRWTPEDQAAIIDRLEDHLLPG